MLVLVPSHSPQEQANVAPPGLVACLRELLHLPRKTLEMAYTCNTTCGDTTHDETREVREKMKLNPKNQKHLNGFLAILLAGFFLPGCSATSVPETNPSVQAQSGNPALQPSGPPGQSGNPAPQMISPPSGVATAGQFEQPPVVNIGELLPPTMQSGPGYQVGQQVPTNGAMGQYTITATPDVFKADAGTYQIESLDLLKIRLSEVPAIAQLDNMSNTEQFAKAFAASAERPVADAAQMVMHPMDTVTGLPSGVGQFFGRVELGAETVYSTATNSSENGGQRAKQTAAETGSVALTALGYDQVRRDLAKKLHVDPYSSDPILTNRLNHAAWVMFSARLMVNTAISVAVPGSMLITGVEFTDDLVYQTPKGDLVLLVEKKLRKMGLSDSEIATFSHNSAIPLSLQVSAVHYLELLGPIPGRHAAATAIGSVMTEYQARFLVTSVQMLATWNQQKSPIAKIKVLGLLIGRDQTGTAIMPAPVDYVSWTPRIAGFATDSNLLAIRSRVLWITGKMTPLARQQLDANGWKVRQGSQF